jgi:hypothetical protein
MTRTQWAVVVGLLAFILAIFGILLYQLQVPSPLPTPAPPAFLLDEGSQARSVYPIAAQEAQRWQEDAQLFSVGITWDDLGPGGVLKRDRWTFEFFSPSQGQMAVIRATDGQAERLRTALLPNRLQVLPLDQWLVDSTQALQTWWERGGGDFIRQHTRVSIGLKLRMEPKGTRALWTVAGSASDQHWVVRIDSRDGMVVE